MVLNRDINGRRLTRLLLGLLHQNDVLMYDRQTESLWSQLAIDNGGFAELRLANNAVTA